MNRVSEQEHDYSNQLGLEQRNGLGRCIHPAASGVIPVENTDASNSFPTLWLSCHEHMGIRVAHADWHSRGRRRHAKQRTWVSNYLQFLVASSHRDCHFRALCWDQSLDSSRRQIVG
jgi:hypothetical protein